MSDAERKQCGNCAFFDSVDPEDSEAVGLCLLCPPGHHDGGLNDGKIWPTTEPVLRCGSWQPVSWLHLPGSDAPAPLEALLSPREVATLLGWATVMVTRRAQQGLIPGVVLPDGSVRFRASDYRKFFESLPSAQIGAQKR